LRVIAAGFLLDLVTPLVGRKTADKCSKRDEIASAVWKHCRISQLPSWLRERELIQRGMIGSMSNVAPYLNGLVQGVDLFFVQHNVKIDPHAAKIADSFVKTRVKQGSLSSVPLGIAAESFEGRTSYGWPFVTSNPRYHEQAKDLSGDLLRGTPSEFEAYPAILGTRGQSAGLAKPPKSRVVWQCSRVVANLEKMVFIPLFKALQHQPGFAAWTSAMEVDRAITGMFDGDRHYRRPSAWSPVMSVDFSKFDVTLPHSVINRVYSIIRSWFRVEDHVLLSNLSHYVTTVSLATPVGMRTGKLRGIPSGSVMTNMLDSLCNLWVIAYGAARLGSSVAAAEVQGDDGVYVFAEQIDPDELQAVLAEDLGMVISPDKGLIAENEVHYLQNVHRRSYRSKYNVCCGIRPIMRVLNGMMSYERFRPGWNGFLDSVRWAMQLSSAWHHPGFPSFAEWLLDHDANVQIYDAESIVEKAGGREVIERFLGKRYDGAVMFCDDVADCPGFLQMDYASSLRRG